MNSRAMTGRLRLTERLRLTIWCWIGASVIVAGCTAASHTVARTPHPVPPPPREVPAQRELPPERERPVLPELPAQRELPPQPVPARQPGTPAVPPTASQASPPAAEPRSGEPVVPAALRGPAVPVWKIGDQWAYRWESPQGQGEYVWTVDRTEVVDGVEQYVIKVGPREIYYRKSDLATTVEMVAGAVETRHVPPRLSFSWPLTPGTLWRQSYTEERGPHRHPHHRAISWQVEAEENTEVEAGTFKTFKVVARHLQDTSIMYEMWFAPEVKQWVQLKEHFPSGIRYRELTASNLK